MIAAVNETVPRFKKLPAFPEVQRDLAVIVPVKTSWDELEKVIKKGRVDITDAVLLNKVAAGAVTLDTAEKQVNADCDANGEVDSKDAVVLLKFLVSLIKTLPSAE